jgi:ribosomal protein S18 acetylase RimI-like enzyme
LGLLPGYRGRGYGKALLQRAIDWAAEQGLRYLWLATRSENERAIRLFLELGFHPTGEWLGEEQVMTRSL